MPICERNDPFIQSLCRRWGAILQLKPGEPLGPAVLMALYLNERYNEKNQSPRFEAAYGPGGRYYNDKLWTVYGYDSARSFSNWQILFPVAVEMGYTGIPHGLENDSIAVHFVTELLNRRLLRLCRKDDGVVSLREILDSYNSGNPRDHIIPEPYIKRGTEHYAEALKILRINQGG